MDDKSGTVAVKQGCRTCPEGDVPYQILDSQLPAAGHLNIGQVARVRTVGLQKPVPLADWREVRASGFERRRFTAPCAVKMDRVNSTRRMLKVEPEEHPVRRLLETRLSDGAALCVSEHCPRKL